MHRRPYITKENLKLCSQREDRSWELLNEHTMCIVSTCGQPQEKFLFVATVIIST